MNFKQEVHFLLDLILADEDVAVVLLELPHAREARERAGHFVAVQHVERDVAERQLAIRVLLRLIQQVVRRAVHGLEREVVLARLVVEDEEHVLAVFAPVPGDLPQPLVVQQRRSDLLKIVALPLADEIVERVEQHRAALGPEDRAGRELVHHEQVELLAEHAMVALLGFLDAREVRVEILLLEEGGAVNALQHLPLRVAAPIRAGRVRQLEVLEARRVGHVRAATEIDERTVGIRRDDLVVSQLGEPLELERIVGEQLLRLRASDLIAHERILLGRDLPHLVLERGEILRRERLGDLEVVVESVVDRRTEPDLRVRAQAPDGGRQHVGGGMPEHVERPRVAIREDAEISARSAAASRGPGCCR